MQPILQCPPGSSIPAADGLGVQVPPLSSGIPVWGMSNRPAVRRIASAGLFGDIHAILDEGQQEVYYCTLGGTWGEDQVKCQSFEEYKRHYPSWRVVATASSPQHGAEVIERARSRLDQTFRWRPLVNHSRDFARFCFAGPVTDTPSSQPAQSFSDALGPVAREMASDVAQQMARATVTAAINRIPPFPGASAIAGANVATAGAGSANSAAATGSASAGVGSVSAGVGSATAVSGIASGQASGAAGVSASTGAGSPGAAAVVAGALANAVAAAGSVSAGAAGGSVGAGPSVGASAASGHAGVAASASSGAGSASAAAGGTSASGTASAIAQVGMAKCLLFGTVSATTMAVAGHLWCQYGKQKAEARAPIRIRNQSTEVIQVTLRTIASWDTLHNTVHRLRAQAGVGKIKAEIAAGTEEFLYPPCEEWFEDFSLTVARICQTSILCVVVGHPMNPNIQPFFLTPAKVKCAGQLRDVFQVQRGTELVYPRSTRH